MPEHCYRHPKRETAVSCSGCGRPICTDCMTPSPVGMRCPECAGQRTKVRTASTVFGGSNAPRATMVLIGINAAVFLLEIAGGGSAASFGGGGSLINDFGVRATAISDHGEWFRILTGGFLHAGPLHLLLNMYVLWVLGTLLEPAIGTPRFVGIYFVSLITGSLGALVVSPDATTVGASGAIYGIFAATILIARRRGVEQIAGPLLFWLLLNLVFTFSISGISIGGHLGGLTGGFIAAAIVTAGERGLGGTHTLRNELLAMAALGAIAFAGALAIA